MVADLILVGLEVLGQRPEQQASVDGTVGVDGLDLVDERLLGHILGQDKLHNLDADELSARRCALFIGQIGRIFAAADDGEPGADALFLQRRDTLLQLFVHRSGNFFTQ